MRPVALIGPAGAGKSTIGALVANRLGRRFVDVDDVGHRYYDGAGQPLDDLVERVANEGFAMAHRWWQPARLAAASAIGDFPEAVIAFGAGHSHFEDDSYVTAIRLAFGAAFVVLLLPSKDPAQSVRVLRQRCMRDKGSDWVRDGHDYLVEWTHSSQNAALADCVVYGEGRKATEIAEAVAQAVEATAAG